MISLHISFFSNLNKELIQQGDKHLPMTNIPVVWPPAENRIFLVTSVEFCTEVVESSKDLFVNKIEPTSETILTPIPTGRVATGLNPVGGHLRV